MPSDSISVGRRIAEEMVRQRKKNGDPRGSMEQLATRAAKLFEESYMPLLVYVHNTKLS